MFATLSIVQLYCRNYSVFYNATEHLSYVLQDHLLDTMEPQDKPLLTLMLKNADDFESRMIAMYGFCTTPLCKTAKRLMCAHVVRQVRDPLHLLAIWGETPGKSHPYSGPFPTHIPFAEDLRKARYVFHDLVLPTVDLAWIVRLELRARSKSERIKDLCWAKNIPSVKEALRLACKGSKQHMVTLSRFISQEIRYAGKTVRYQKLTPPMPLAEQAQQGMTSIESHHPAHPAAFRQLQSLLSHISSVTLQNRMNSICTALVDFNQVCLIAPSNLYFEY